MAKHDIQSNQTNLAVTGLLCAALCIVTLSGALSKSPMRWKAAPEARTALKEARAHMKKSHWTRAAAVLSSSAIESNPIILLEMGKLLSRGWGVPRNLDKARDILLVAVQQHFPKRGYAAYELAKVFQKSTDEDCERLAFEWFNKAVQWGFGKAHGELGRHYARGIGVGQDMQKALHHYQLAAQHGSAKSMLSFIHLLQRQPDINANLPSSAALLARIIPQLEIEALNGRASSAKALGRFYMNGKLITPNTITAELWLQRSVDMGDGGAMAELAGMLLKGAPKKEQIRRALRLLQTAGQLHDGGALTASGRLHLSGKFGLKQSIAIDLFQRGIDNAHPGAMLEMAKLLLRGELVMQDANAALKLLKRGASLGHKGSKRLLKKVQKKLNKKLSSNFKSETKLSRFQPVSSRKLGRARGLSGATYQ